MKKILVTGGAGYIGSHAVRKLIRRGYAVVVVDNLSKGYQESVDPNATFVHLDLNNFSGLKKLFAEHRFDGVMHFAGLIEVGLSMKEPVEFFKTNCLYGMHLLEAMREANVKNIIFSSTAAVYGNPTSIPIREDAQLSPTNFYGQSKLMFEQLLKKYQEFYGFTYVALRYFNAAGADMSSEIGQAYSPDTHLIPRALRTVLGAYDVFKIYGTDYDTPDGTCIRDYIHVSDLIDAHILALDYLWQKGQSKIFNLGNGNGFSVREVLQKIEEVIGRAISLQEGERREGDPPVLVADASLARSELGWKPLLGDLATIIETAWKWHSSHPYGYKKLA